MFLWYYSFDFPELSESEEISSVLIKKVSPLVELIQQLTTTPGNLIKVTKQTEYMNQF